MLNRIVAIFLLLLISPIFILLFIIILFFDGFPLLFTQKRVGTNNSIFLLYKFRTMKKNVGDIPTHMVKNARHHLSKTGPFFRRFSFDELPQLVNIIRGEMVFVGPRPALYNQDDLIKLRVENGIHRIKPGVTGWAQVNGRDELSIPDKVQSYLACGKPILGMVDGEAAKIIKEANAGLTCPSGDSIGLYKNILVMNKMPSNELQQIGKNSHNYYKNYFDRELLLNKAELIITKIISGHRNKLY